MSALAFAKWQAALWELSAIERRRVWTSGPGELDGWLPWIGGDEFQRKTLVVGTPLTGHVVVALWRCRCDDCAAHVAELTRIVDAGPEDMSNVDLDEPEA